MIKKRQPSKSFLDISNTYVKGTLTSNISQTHSFLRRKSERFLEVIKNQSKLKQNQVQMPKHCYPPLAKYERSGSQVFNRTFDQPESKQLQSVGSLNTSTITPPLSKRFQRKSQRKFQATSAVSKEKTEIVCSQQSKIAEEKRSLKQKNVELGQQCEKLQAQNERLKQELKQKDLKMATLSNALKQKENELKKINSNLKEKQNAVKQLEENLTNKAKLMVKLQQKSAQLEGKLSQIKRSKAVSIQEAEFNEKMNVVMERLRYKQLEVHILKKELFEIKELEKRFKVVLKENTQLKQRIKFYVRKKYNEEMVSTSSLSYSCLSFSPEKFER